MRLNRQLSVALVLSSIGHFTLAVDRWCGKAYRPGDPAVDPGGRLDPPARSPSPLLNFQIRPAEQPYLATDVIGAFIVDAPLSYFYGQPYGSVLVSRQNNGSLNLLSPTAKSETLSFQVSRSDSSTDPIPEDTVEVNSTSTLFDFDLSKFEARFEPYNISITATRSDGRIYKASTQIVRLPSRTDGGSVTKIDNLHGSLLVKATSGAWTPFFPYSYFVDGNWLAANPDNMRVLKNYGYNVLHIIPAGGLGYDFAQLDAWLDSAQHWGLHIMYDMRWQYQNSTGVEWQVNRIKARPNMLLWYTADEPDGQMDALDAPKRAYDQIKTLDPYHPVSLCLNCENYHYQEYSAGADIILSDVYPIGTNTSWSTEHNTVCNTTYGDCGCDNCQGYNNVSNVPARLDTFRDYQSQLGLPPKILWGTPQAFGNSQFWKRTPTEDEEIAMTALSISHGAKGITMWTFPTTPELTTETSRFSSSLSAFADKYLLEGELQRGEAVRTSSGAAVDTIDVSVWSIGHSALVIAVNTADEFEFGLTLNLPAGMSATSITDLYWGDHTWFLTRVGSRKQLESLGRIDPFTTDIFVVDLTPGQVTSGQYVNVTAVA